MFRFDESDPRFLVAIDGTHDADITNYQEMMRRWVARCRQGGRFGVILVTEPHEHPEGEDHHERNVAFEEAFTKLLNDFRRDHKADAERFTVGYARVMPAEYVTERVTAEPTFMDTARASTDRMARYMWGVAGSLFGDLDEAKAWLGSLIDHVPSVAEAESKATKPDSTTTSRRIGLFYGSTTGVTEIAAERIQAVWADCGMGEMEAINVGTVKDLNTLLTYDYLILGIPTWNVGQLQDDWEIALPRLAKMTFSGKQIALFGVGDQYGYPENYLDAVGILGATLVERGATLVGAWYDPHYEFSASKAFVGGKFMGLGLDEVHQSDHSERRIRAWVQQIITEFALLPTT
jgi:flavodoxin long chain